MLIYAPMELQAQSTFGSIIGTIQDATGAAMPGVAVKLKNLQRQRDSLHRQLTTRANIDSQSQARLIRISASKENFNTATLGGIALDARQQTACRPQAGARGRHAGCQCREYRCGGQHENAIIATPELQSVVQLPMNYRVGTTVRSPRWLPCRESSRIATAICRLAAERRRRSSIQWTDLDSKRTSEWSARKHESVVELISEMKVTQFNNNAEFRN